MGCSKSMIEVHSISNLSEWAEDQGVLFLEKATDGRVGLNDINFALDEYKRLYKAGIASPAEMLTLSRAYPENRIYTKALKKMGISDDDSLVVGGPASIELVDREGHLITTAALNKAFHKYMANFRTRNAMVLHSDVQVGWALPAYISKGGQIFKSGVDDKGLFFITELRNDTKISQKVAEQIHEGKLKSYSIAGSAIKTQTIQKGLQSVMQVDELELAEVTVCEKGVNQGANFDILKAEGAATSSCIDGSCLISKGESCDCGNDSQGVVLMFKSSGDIDFTKSFFNHVGVFQKEEDPMSGESFPSLMNTQGRQDEHHRFLDRYGFPAELEPEFNRYTPVIEYDPSPWGHKRPPWVVNEAGSNLGERYYEDALATPQIGQHTQRGVAEGGNSGETPVTQLNETDAFNKILAKADPAGTPSATNPKPPQHSMPKPPLSAAKDPKEPLAPKAISKLGPALAAGALGAVAGKLFGGGDKKEGSQEQSVNVTTNTNKSKKSISKAADFFNWMEQEGAHLYKESCPCEFCFQKTSDYRGTVERGAGF